MFNVSDNNAISYGRAFHLFMRSSLAITFLLLVAVLSAGAQTGGGAIEIEEDGRLWIEGSASVVDYTCRAEQLSGNGTIENTANPQQNVQGDGQVAVTVRIPVKSLECGKKKMNRDMYGALKADEFDNISYHLLQAEMMNDASSDSIDEDWMNIRTRGILEIAGETDTTEVLVEGKLIDQNRFQVRGSNSIDMKNFDIKPPTAMFGLIKADNTLTVRFDVTVRLSNS